MKIGIIGAGPSGLVTAAVLRAFGHEVVVVDKAPDVGGVWSATRAYPGVSTQDDRITYAFSDTPMPADYPDHPSGEQVRTYLQGYASAKGLDDCLRLGTRVASAEQVDGDRWVLRLVDERSAAAAGDEPVDGERVEVDWLVLANGVFSTPHVPAWPGRAAFEAAGGRVLVPTGLGDGAALAGQRVVVIGWGKTACDIAAASAHTARSTTLVARAVRWKMPKRMAGGLTFKHLLLTRAGEHLLAPERTTLRQRALAAASTPLRRAVIALLSRHIARASGLPAADLVPTVSLPHCDSLVTDGFFEALDRGDLQVRRERSVVDLGVVDGEPGARLSDGAWLPADAVVPATGFEQDVALLSPAVREALLEPDGSMVLHRRILPARVPHLAFAGWGNTYRSPLTAEVGAVWLAGHLAGALAPRSDAEVARTAERYSLTHERAAARGEQQLPSGSFAALDQLLADLDLPLSAAERRRQWAQPLDPATYASLVPRLAARLAASAAPPEAVGATAATARPAARAGR